MFKQLSILALTVSCSYAMESIQTTPTGDIDIKQTTEEVKSNNTINDVTKTDTQDVTLTKVVNTDNKSVEDIKQNQNNSKNTGNEAIEGFSVFDFNKTNCLLNGIKNGYNTKSKNGTNDNQLFDFNSLKGKLFIDMTPDEQNWMQLLAYDKFSKTCQAFYQKILRQKELTDRDKEELFKTPEFSLCIRADINPLRVLDDEIRFNLHPLCLMVPNLEKVQKQVWDFTDEVIKRTARIKARIIAFYKFKAVNHITDSTLALKAFLYLRLNRHRKMLRNG